MWRNHDLRLIALLVFVATALGHFLVFRLAMPKVLGGYYDFAAYYAATQIIKDGSGRDLYNYDTQLTAQQRFSPVRTRPLLYNHPPFEALVFLPFGYFPYSQAYVLWSLANLLLLFIIAILLFPYLSSLWASLHSGLVVAAFFSFFPIFVAVLQGQDSVLLLFIYTLLYIAMKQGRELASGVLLAFGAFRPQLILPLLLAFGFRRRWKVLLGFLSACAVLAFASVEITGWQGATAYLRLLWTMNQGAREETTGEDAYFIHPAAMPNLRGFFHAQLAGRIPEPYVTAGILASSLLLLFWSMRTGIAQARDARTDLDLPFALHLTVTVLVSYHLHLHDLSLMLLPIVLVANRLAGEKDFQSRGRLGLASMVVFLFLSPVYMVGVILGRLNLLALPILVFAVLVAREISRGGRFMAPPRPE